ncbi:Collagen alpha-4(VI) chain [Bulinus truncatus]|nr:Collagen alpha-4(VI) chain [Bulinus truncatus]
MRLALSFLLTFALMTICQGMLKKFHVDGGSKEKTNVQSVHGGRKERTHVKSVDGGRGTKERTYEKSVHGGRDSKERTHEQSVRVGRGSKERTNTQRSLNNGGEKTERPKVIDTLSPDTQKPVGQVGTKSFSLLGSLLNPINQIVGGAVNTGVNLFCAVVGKLIPCKDAPLPFKCRTIADVIFVVDSSGSIGPTNFKKQLSFIANIVASFNVGADDVRIGLVVFSTNAEIWFDLRKYSDLLSLQKAILNVPYEGEATYTDKGLRLISSADMFNKNKGGRNNAPDVVIVLTDGQSTNPTGTLTEAMKLKSQGVKMLSVGISSYIQKSELLSLASSPEYFFEADDFDTLSSILGGFVEKTCTASEGVKVSVQTETERYIGKIWATFEDAQADNEINHDCSQVHHHQAVNNNQDDNNNNHDNDYNTEDNYHNHATDNYYNHAKDNYYNHATDNYHNHAKDNYHNYDNDYNTKDNYHNHATDNYYNHAKDNYHNYAKDNYHNHAKDNYHNYNNDYNTEDNYHNHATDNYHNYAKDNYDNYAKDNYHNHAKDNYHNYDNDYNTKDNYHNHATDNYYNHAKDNYHNYAKDNYHNYDNDYNTKDNYHNHAEDNYHNYNYYDT